MNFLSSFGKAVGGIVFYFSLNILILSMVVAQFLQYDSVQPVISGLIEKQMVGNATEDQLTAMHRALVEECKKPTNNSISFPISESRNLTFSCSEINQIKPSDFPKMVSKNLFDEIYYKKYDCEFIQCFSKGIDENNPLLFLNFKAYKFFDSLKIYCIIGLASSVIIFAVSVKTWYGVAKNIGSSCLVTGIPFFILLYYKEPIIQKLANIPKEGLQIALKIFESTMHMLLVVFIVGIILTVAGVVGKHFAKKKVKKGKKK
jgi:hypothetical protein